MPEQVDISADAPAERVCKKCGETKPLEQFVKAPQCKFGREYTCVECRRGQIRELKREQRRDPAYRQKEGEYSREYYKDPAHREGLREYQRERSKDPAFREQQRAYQREYRKDPVVRARDCERSRERRKDPAARERDCERSRERRKDPVYRERQRQYNHERYKNSPTFREQLREYADKRRRDPVMREQRREYIRQYKRERYEADPRAEMIPGSKHRAKSKGMPHTITLDDIPFPHPYCPALGPDVPMARNEGSLGPNSPSLDRIDSDPAIGYVPNNIAVISHLANRIKGNRTPAQLYKRAETIFRKSEQLTGTLREHQRNEAWLTLKVAQYSERALRASRFAQHIENSEFLKFDNATD